MAYSSEMGVLPFGSACNIWLPGQTPPYFSHFLHLWGYAWAGWILEVEIVKMISKWDTFRSWCWWTKRRRQQVSLITFTGTVVQSTAIQYGNRDRAMQHVAG